jgi:hypothetical protein
LSALTGIRAIEWDLMGVLFAVGSGDGFVRIYDFDEVCLTQQLLRNATTQNSAVELSSAPTISLVRGASIPA